MVADQGAVALIGQLGIGTGPQEGRSALPEPLCKCLAFGKP